MSTTPDTNPDEGIAAIEAAAASRDDAAAADRELSELQRRVEQSLASERVALPIGADGVEMDFYTMGREESEYANLLQERFDRLDGDDYAAEFSEELDRIYGMLSDLSVEEFATREWWEDMVAVPKAITLLQAIQAERDLSEVEVKK